ncbi:MAG: hypothetical protein P1V51_03560 [Deltaproteobacteria bacterium]|nr:hypothetical protein [Deltaproteobacteria bacterium]
MAQKKTLTPPSLETFDIAAIGQLWTESATRMVDEFEKAGQATLTQIEKLGEESRKVADTQLKTARRLFDTSIETARRVTDAFQA